MSADNSIVVQKRGSKWHVWVQFESSDNKEPHGPFHRAFDSSSEAMTHALWMDTGGVEYGIRVLEDA